MAQQVISPAHRNGRPQVDARGRLTNETNARFGAAFALPEPGWDVPRDLQITAARAVVVADRKRGRVTERWIVELASQTA